MIQGGFFAIYYNAETLKRTETIENLLCVSVNILILLDLNRVETLKRCFLKKILQKIDETKNCTLCGNLRFSVSVP